MMEIRMTQMSAPPTVLILCVVMGLFKQARSVMMRMVIVPIAREPVSAGLQSTITHVNQTLLKLMVFNG